MNSTASYREGLIQRLSSDPQEAAEYLKAAFEDDINVAMIALRDVIEAHKGLTSEERKVLTKDLLNETLTVK